MHKSIIYLFNVIHVVFCRMKIQIQQIIRKYFQHLSLNIFGLELLINQNVLNYPVYKCQTCYLNLNIYNTAEYLNLYLTEYKGHTRSPESIKFVRVLVECGQTELAAANSHPLTATYTVIYDRKLIGFLTNSNRTKRCLTNAREPVMYLILFTFQRLKRQYSR